MISMNRTFIATKILNLKLEMRLLEDLCSKWFLKKTFNLIWIKCEPPKSSPKFWLFLEFFIIFVRTSVWNERWSEIRQWRMSRGSHITFRFFLYTFFITVGINVLWRCRTFQRMFLAFFLWTELLPCHKNGPYFKNCTLVI